MITPSFGLTATERVLPKLALDFTTASLDNRITFTRAGNTATCVNSSGNVAIVNENLPRFDYDPTTLVCKGLLIEEARTNSIRNNTMQGTVAGTPGTMPTNWTASTSASGITREIVGTGTENGINYIDIKISGTPATTATFNVNPEPVGVISASTGQSWTLSSWIKRVAGTSTNITNPAFYFDERNGSSFVTGGEILVSYLSTTQQRYSATRTLSGGATVTTINVGFRIGLTAGAAVDITLRYGLPQLELGAFSTSVIPTETTTVTRNADVATMTGTNFSDWYNASEGAFYCDVTPFKWGSTTTFESAFAASDGTSSNVIAIQGRGGASSRLIPNGRVAIAGVETVALVLSPLAVGNTNVKATFSYKVDNFAGAYKGNAVVTSSSGALPTIDRLMIMSETPTARWLSGHIHKLLYWPQRITNAEVQSFSKG